MAILVIRVDYLGRQDSGKAEIFPTNKRQDGNQQKFKMRVIRYEALKSQGQLSRYQAAKCPCSTACTHSGLLQKVISSERVRSYMNQTR
jgi:hypothetical protein